MKKMFDKEHIWTTLTSILGFVLAALVIFGIISADDKEALKNAWDAVVAAIPLGDFTTILSTAVAFILLVVGLFAKDNPNKPDKKPSK